MADSAEVASKEVQVEKAAAEEVAEKTAGGDVKAEAETANVEAKGEKKDAAANGASEEKEAVKELDGEKKERAIIRQVEYYFGDANLGRDKFLREMMGKNEDGWVPLSVLITFKRLAALSTDFEEITNALIKSDEGLVEISEDKQSLRRHPERPLLERNDETRKEIQERTVYAKGFPLTATIEELLSYFSAYDKVENVTMRKYVDKPTKKYKFKGSVFVTFATKEQAKAFLDKDKVVYEERELLRKWQITYLEHKRQEYEQRNEVRKNKKEKEVKAEPEIELPKNAIVVFEGAPETVSRDEIREVFDQIENFEVAFIEFNKGQTHGAVRFTEAETAEKLIAQVEKKLKLNDDVTLTLRKATEEEEKQFLTTAIEFIKKRRDFSRNRKRHGRKRGGGNENHHKNKARRVD